MKPIEIYASVHAVNSAAAQMAEHIEKLKETGLIGAEQADHRIASIEEIRALTSADVGVNINSHELDSAGAAEQQKLAIEQKWVGNASDPWNQPAVTDAQEEKP